MMRRHRVKAHEHLGTISSQTNDTSAPRSHLAAAFVPHGELVTQDGNRNSRSLKCSELHLHVRSRMRGARRHSWWQYGLPYASTPCGDATTPTPRVHVGCESPCVRSEASAPEHSCKQMQFVHAKLPDVSKSTRARTNTLSHMTENAILNDEILYPCSIFLVPVLDLFQSSSITIQVHPGHPSSSRPKTPKQSSSPRGSHTI